MDFIDRRFSPHVMSLLSWPPNSLLGVPDTTINGQGPDQALLGQALGLLRLRAFSKASLNCRQCRGSLLFIRLGLEILFGGEGIVCKFSHICILESLRTAPVSLTSPFWCLYCCRNQLSAHLPYCISIHVCLTVCLSIYIHQRCLNTKLKDTTNQRCPPPLNP